MNLQGLLLLSGGIDSPVAGWLMKRKMELAAVHYYTKEFTGTESLEKSLKLAERIGIGEFYSIDASSEFALLAERAFHKYYFVLTKRLMFRTGEMLAKGKMGGAGFLVSGESIGQVASQTTANLETISEAVGMPIARPLLAMGKEEIIEIARRIGTFEISTGKEFCDFLGPKKPATGASLQAIKEEERELPDLAQALVAKAKLEKIGA